MPNLSIECLHVHNKYNTCRGGLALPLTLPDALCLNSPRAKPYALPRGVRITIVEPKQGVRFGSGVLPFHSQQRKTAKVNYRQACPTACHHVSTTPAAFIAPHVARLLAAQTKTVVVMQSKHRRTTNS